MVANWVTSGRCHSSARATYLALALSARGAARSPPRRGTRCRLAWLIFRPHVRCGAGPTSERPRDANRYSSWRGKERYWAGVFCPRCSPGRSQFDGGQAS